MSQDAYIHPTAELGDGVRIGARSKIWHFVQLRPGVSIGEDCILGRDVYIDEDISIGNAVKIQNRASVYKDCVIEDGVFIGPHVVFTNDQNPRAINPDGTLKSADDWHAGSTRVQRGAAIGAGSVILPSKNIGQFALVGAGSVVTKDVGDYEIVVGNPARVVGYACACGHRLQDAGNDSLECPECGSTYVRLENGTISPQP